MLKRLDFNLLGTSSSSSSSSSSLRQQHDHPAHGIVSEDVQSILKQLNCEELEIAARASHEYNDNDNDVDDDTTTDTRTNNHRSRSIGTSSTTTTGKNSMKQRDYYASKMIQRYLVIHQNNIPKALKHIKDTIQFRKTIDIDHLLNAPTNRSSEHYIPLRTFFSTKKLYVQGYDKDGRSTYYFIPRYIQQEQQEQQEQQYRQQNQLKQSKQNHQYHHQNQNQQHHNNNYMSLHSKYTIRGHVWTIERAIACSKSIDKTINAVVDFSGFIPTKHSPSFSVGKDLMTTLSNYYIHHINNIYLVDVPFTFLCLWNVYKKFACKQTRSKIHFVQSVDPTTARHQRQRQHDKKHLGNQHPFFVHRSNSIDRTEGSVVRHNNSTTATTTATSGSTNNNRILYDFYEKDQLPSWMIPGGTKNRELDVIEYLDTIPFHHAFDE